MNTNIAEQNELKEFSHAIEAQIIKAEELQKTCLSALLKNVKRDMDRWIRAHAENLKSFEDVYEDLTHLYVFSVAYLSPESVEVAFAETA